MLSTVCDYLALLYARLQVAEGSKERRVVLGVKSVCFVMMSVLVSIFVVLCTLRSIFVNFLVIVIPVMSATAAVLIYLP